MAQEYKVTVFEDQTVWKNMKGEYHRLDGPAIKHSCGSAFWLKNGRYHREDGPAIEWSDGHRLWYVNGIRLTEEDFNQLVFKLV